MSFSFDEIHSIITVCVCISPLFDVYSCFENSFEFHKEF